MKKWIFTAVVLSAMTAAGCVTGSNDRDTLIADNKVKDNRIILLERENSVIKKENADTTRELRESEAHNEKLRNDYGALKKKYETDTAMLSAQTEKLKKNLDTLDRESSQKIKELAALNLQLEKNLADETKLRSEELRKAAESYNAERELLKSGFAQKEAELVKQVNAANERINTLERDKKELEGKLKKVQADLSKCREESALSKNKNEESGNKSAETK